MALLEVKGVTKMFGALQALGGVDLSVQAGTFHGLIGPNGSGKSTLLKAIAGAHFPSNGTITFAGLDVTAALPFERARGSEPEVPDHCGLARTLGLRQRAARAAGGAEPVVADPIKDATRHAR